MGLFNWFGKRGEARMLARSAHETYLKHKASDSNLTEAEIAHVIFMQRCSSRNLSKAEKIRYKNYLETEENVDSLYNLCLAMVNIVLNISKKDVTAFQTVRKVIEEELNRAGYKISSV